MAELRRHIFGNAGSRSIAAKCWLAWFAVQKKDVLKRVFYRASVHHVRNLAVVTVALMMIIGLVLFQRVNFSYERNVFRNKTLW